MPSAMRQPFPAPAERDAMCAWTAEPKATDQLNSQTQTALSNSFVLVVAKAITWGLAFVMTVMLPRHLGAVGFGRLYFAISLTAVFAIIVEFGLNSLVTRDVARKPEEAWNYLLVGSAMKLLLWVLAFGIILAATWLLSTPGDTRAAVLVLTVAVAVTSLSSLVVAILQARDKMRWIGVGQIAEKVVLTGLGVPALLLGAGFVAIAAIMLLSAIVALLLNLYFLVRLSRSTALRVPGTPLTSLRALFVRSLPFFSVLFFGAIYFRIDVILLSTMAGDAAVGWYGAAYKLFETLSFAPQVFMFAFLPMFSRMAATADDALALAAQKGLNWLLLVGVPVAVGTALLAGDIIATLYGPDRFTASVPVLQALAATILFLYANGVSVTLLIATERQGKLAVTAAVAAGLNVALNVALIPHLAQLGCALATLATEMVVLGLNTCFLPASLLRRLSFAPQVRPFAAAAAMALALFALEGSPLLVTIPVGVVTYAAAAMALKALSKEDIDMLKNAVFGLRLRGAETGGRG